MHSTERARALVGVAVGLSALSVFLIDAKRIALSNPIIL